MSSDARGWRMALVPDSLVNPPQHTGSTIPDVLCLLEATGYGVLQLPPAGGHGLLLSVIADQVAEYAHHGYAVVAIGVRGKADEGLHWRRLAALLRHRGIALPPRHLIRTDGDTGIEGGRLAAFLSGYDLPQEERRRWRV
ncbi:MAG: hypothetical protein JOZ89_07610 [Gammaproteobacteria bacterium]|nr:hypothetical protein [Gammaproteobacteria bacterium]